MKSSTSALATRKSISLTSGLILLMAFAGACSSKSYRLTRVTVAGETTMKAQPDAAVVVLSVITQSPQALNAQQDNARKSDAVTQALKASAGADPEVKTADYSLQPQYDYRYNKLPKIIGYEARNSVMVTMGDLTKVGAVIDAASRAGANSVESVSFILRDNSPARGQALAEATRQALNKAESIAKALGGRVARIVEEQESGSTNKPFPDNSVSRNAATDSLMFEARKARPTPIQSAPLNVRSEVQLAVEIESTP
jgi:uncharacterized protein